MKKKLSNLKFNILNFIYKMSIKWCFSDHHKDDCAGCIYRKFKKCPAVNLENNLIDRMEEILNDNR